MRRTEGEPRGMGMDKPDDQEQGKGSKSVFFSSSNKEASIKATLVLVELKRLISQGNEQQEPQLDHKRYLKALLRSDACDSEVEYMLGLRSVDPRPDHDIKFDPEYPVPKAYIKRPERKPLSAQKKRWPFRTR